MLKSENIEKLIVNKNNSENISEAVQILGITEFEFKYIIIKLDIQLLSIFEDLVSDDDIQQIQNETQEVSEDIKNFVDIKTPIKDITDVVILRVFEDDDLPCVDIIFKDENNNLRFGQVYYNEYGPGQCEYYDESRRAKKDLIENINQTYYNN